MSLLVIEGLTKHYGTFKALDDVTMTIGRNEAYGFIGRNGAGKTTTIHVVLSMIAKTSGTLLFDGIPITADDVNYRRKIGYVPDVPSFPSYMTAEEWLAFTYAAHGLDPRKQRETITAVLAEVALGAGKKRIGGFSRGMKQRLAIAQALMHRPMMLIMDEPTSALDPLGRKDVIDIIRRLKQDMTVFYSTHILEDAQKVCDRIGLIEQGKMIFEKDMATIVTDQTLRYFLSVVEPLESLIEHLGTFGKVQDYTVQNGGLSYVVDDETDAAGLLRLLLDAGFHIQQYRREEKTLEDVFIEVLHENHR
ncbi:MAG: ABC transporter ATP-binding protein [Acholeplasmatales bacterium]|nr:MAG: ABC transporter ATP-binding protein [Acholeplasmatales bacterium]